MITPLRREIAAGGADDRCMDNFQRFPGVDLTLWLRLVLALLVAVVVVAVAV